MKGNLAEKIRTVLAIFRISINSQTLGNSNEMDFQNLKYHLNDHLFQNKPSALIYDQLLHISKYKSPQAIQSDAREVFFTSYL